MARVLNVAEKNDAAKNLANILSHGRFTRNEGFSQFNKLYEFDAMLQGQRCYMVMTSVSGHLLTHAFTGHHRKWTLCNPVELFDAPVVKKCIDDMEQVKRTLESEARKATRLVIWTDCDREGENIGFEIIEVCRAVKPGLQVFRAKFSEITEASINRAIQNLGLPDHNQNNAVNVRSELDLRIGAAFTRFQTLRLQKVFPQALADSIISYGSCQFPTLGFVVERYKAIQDFVPEAFWKIKVTHEVENISVDFLWSRVRLFDELACQILLDKCQEQETATVTNVKTKEKSKWRPQPLDTIELEKLGSRKLRINAKETMRVAEKLYTSGYISYPRTETNIFPKEIDLEPLVQMQSADANWGDFASRVLADGINPRQGRKSDQAHPPIHPTKYARNLQGNEKIIYEFIVRHFLACLSKDAKGMETVVDINISEEKFAASGLMIIEKNYLEVYPYDRWSDKEMPIYEPGQTFLPSSIEMIDSQTSPPALLTEADLIALMEKHGIGTDATHADHIETIKSRLYVGLQDTRFVPGQLGMGLVEGYDSMGFEMSKPKLRADLEADLKRICEGHKDPEMVLRGQIQNYKRVFEESLRQAAKIDQALAQFLNEAPQAMCNAEPIPNVPQQSPVAKCSKCGSNIVVLRTKDNKRFYLSCQGFPDCRECLWFPGTVQNVTVTDETCPQCPGSRKLLKFKFTPRVFAPYLPNEYTTCMGGCDEVFLETVGIEAFPGRRIQALPSTQSTNRNGDSGYSSSNLSSLSRQRPILSNQTNVSAQPKPRTAHPANTNAHSFRRAAAPNTQSISTSYTNTFNSTQHNSTNQSQSSADDQYENAIVCHCGQEAMLLTVRKEGPNTGRQFYKCAKQQGQGCCNFFLWLDDFTDDLFGSTNNRPQPPNRENVVRQDTHAMQPSTSGNNQNLDENVTCSCEIAAKRLTVLKEGPNKGRLFYVCSKPRDDQCGFFQWADEVAPSASTNDLGGNNSGTGHGRGGGGSSIGSTQKRKAPGDPPRKRRCGICNEEGHNRLKCPHNNG